MSRTLTIVATVVVLLGAGIAAYFYFFAKPATLSVTPTDTSSFPEAGNVAPISETPSDTITGTPISSGSSVPRLTKISAGPVVPGAVVAEKNGTSSTSPAEIQTSFIERQSGNVFSYANRTGALTRVSNRTIPSIQEAAWFPDASLAFVRYLSGTDFATINTYALPANGSEGSFLAQNLASVAASTSTVLTVASGANGSIGTVARADGSRAVQVFTTPLSSIRASFAGKNRYLVFTKPAASEDGYAFFVDGKNVFTRLAGPLKGLVALISPSGKWLLVSYVEDGGMKTALVDTATREVIGLPVATIADKCAWVSDETAVYCGVPITAGKSASYPDDWYQGAVHFSDRVWKINISGRFAQLVLDFEKEAGAPLDASALTLDTKGRFLVFLNKNDGSLWSYQL